MVHWDRPWTHGMCLRPEPDFKAYQEAMPSTAYAEWLLQTDMTTAYAYGRSVLQMLRRAPGVWSLNAVAYGPHRIAAATFPMRIVWAHRIAKAASSCD